MALLNLTGGELEDVEELLQQQANADLTMKHHLMEEAFKNWPKRKKKKMKHLEEQVRATGSSRCRNQDLPAGLLQGVYLFLDEFASRIDELEEMLTNNRIWKQRLVNIGVVTSREAMAWGLSGVMYLV